MYFQFIMVPSRYLQVLDMSSCTYYVGGGSTFRTEAVGKRLGPRAGDEPQQHQEDSQWKGGVES